MTFFEVSPSFARTSNRTFGILFRQILRTPTMPPQNAMFEITEKKIETRGIFNQF